MHARVEKYDTRDSSLNQQRVPVLSRLDGEIQRWNLNWSFFQTQEWTRKPNNTTVIRVNQSSNQQNQNQNHRPMGGQYQFNSRGDCEEDIDNEPLYDPVAPRIDYEVHDFDANPRDEANRRLAYRLNNIRSQDVIYDGPADDLPMYHASKVRSFYVAID